MVRHFMKTSGFHSHVPEGNLSQQQEAYGIRLRRVTVVGTLGHHVSKVHTFAKHVTRLEKMKQSDWTERGENHPKT